MHADDYIRARIAEFAWRAACHVSIPAILSVMFVIKTRAGDGAWLQNLDYLEKEGAPLNVDKPDIRDPVFLEVLQLVNGIYTGDSGEIARKDIFTDGARWWWDNNFSGFNHWFDMTIRERVAQVGTMTFWR